MKKFLREHLNFIIEWVMVVLLLVIYGTGKNVVSLGMNENVLAAGVLFLWLAWMGAKYLFLGYSIKDEVKEE